MYLVQRLEIDSMENSPAKAMWYENIGYVDNAADVDYLLAETVKGTGWPIPSGEIRPRYRIVHLQKIEKAA